MSAGVVDTPLHRETPKADGEPVTDMYLTDAATVTGDVLYVDGGAHFGRW